MTSRVFIPRDLHAVMALHADLLREYPGDMKVIDVLLRQSDSLLRAHRSNNPGVSVQVSNWLPGYAGRSADEILASPLSDEDMKLTVAREHGFPQWKVVEESGDVPLDPDFEAAVDAIVNGRLPALDRLLFVRPDLVVARSPYGHRATLLHYVAANGVETWRQTVPRIAPQIVRRLIDAGADPAATASFYGGQFATAPLVESSAHPAAAGLTEAIMSELKRK